MAPLVHLLAAATTLAGFTVAVPPPIATEKLATDSLSAGTFSLKEVRNEKYKFNGALSIYMTRLKYGMPIPDYLYKAVARTGLVSRSAGSTGTVGATSVDSTGSAYTVPIYIGTPPQKVDVILDSGSSDLWCFSTLTPSSQVKGQKLYDPSKSSTAELQGGFEWAIGYGDGSSSSGVVYTDKVNVGGVTVPDQVVEAAKNVSVEFTGLQQVDGLLGAGFDNGNTVKPNKAKTFFSNAKSSLSAPVWTADLKHDGPGSYDFGFINSSRYQGDITYVPVKSDDTYWTFSSSGYAVGDGSFQSIESSGIADTGTTVMFLPTSIVHEYYEQVPDAVNSTQYGGYVFPCDTTPPSFTFGVGTARVTIPSSYLNAGPANDTGSVLDNNGNSNNNDNNNNNTCFGGIQAGDDTDHIYIYGLPALKAAFVVFKDPAYGTPTLGWANKTLS